MTTAASLIERHPGFVDLAIRSRDGVQSYVISAAVSLDAAYAGATAMKTLQRGVSFRSKTLRRKMVEWLEESNRGLTRFTFDPRDYASTTIPGDSDVTFIRVSEVVGGTTEGAGPILVVPPPGFFSSGRSILNLSGTAPNVSGRSNHLPSPSGMRIMLPKFADRVDIFNDDGANSLFVAFGLGTQEVEVPKGTEIKFLEAGASEIIVRGQGGTVAFRLVLSVVNGIQA